MEKDTDNETCYSLYQNSALGRLIIIFYWMWHVVL